MTPLPRRRARRYRVPRGFMGERVAPLSDTMVLWPDHSLSRFSISLLVALIFHGVILGVSLFTKPALKPNIKDQLTQEVTLEKPPPPAPPPPPPEPPKPRPPQARAPTPRTPPPAAEAGKVIARAAPPDEPLDMTQFDMAIGKGNSYVGGYTASTGTSNSAVKDLRAAPKGIANLGPSRARAAVPAATDWACAWPDEELNSDVRDVRVAIRVHVDRDGDAETVDLLGLATPGFAAAARRCALAETYLSARDDSGKSIPAVTTPFLVHFFR